MYRFETERTKPAPKGTKDRNKEKRSATKLSPCLPRKYLELLELPKLFDQESSCVEKTSLLGTIVTTGLDYIIPLRTSTVRSTEPPWMTSKLIKKRQKALNQGNTHLFKLLRNKVNRERKICRAKYYENSVRHLKNCKPSSWWREVRKLSGKQSVSRNRDEILKALRPSELHTESDKLDLANEINDTFLSPLTEFTTLSPDYYRDLFSAITNEESTITVTTGDVFEKLSMLNPKKAHGPDGIPIWVLKENADPLAFPIKEILNSSFRECPATLEEC